MVVARDPLGVAIIRPTTMSDASRHALRNAVHKLLPECPAAIVIDLSGVSHVPKPVQMTLLSLVVEAGQEPAVPLGFCTGSGELARELARNGRTMRVFATTAEARRALTDATSATPWIHRSLGSGSSAPGMAAAHTAEACQFWPLSGIQAAARTVAFHLVWLARGPYELYLTLSLRPRRLLLINVRNYSTAAKASGQRNVRMGLGPADEARILAKGATGCGRLVTGAGVAWWAMLSGEAPA